MWTFCENVETVYTLYTPCSHTFTSDKGIKQMNWTASLQVLYNQVPDNEDLQKTKKHTYYMMEGEGGRGRENNGTQVGLEPSAPAVTTELLYMKHVIDQLSYQGNQSQYSLNKSLPFKCCNYFLYACLFLLFIT